MTSQKHIYTIYLLITHLFNRNNVILHNLALYNFNYQGTLIDTLRDTLREGHDTPIIRAEKLGYTCVYGFSTGNV